MDLKRYFRGPVVWVVVIAFVGLALIKFVSVGQAPKDVSLSKVDNYITTQQVVKATIKDKEQQVVLKLKDGAQVDASYPIHGDTALLAQIEQYCKPTACDYTTTVSHDSVLSSLFFSILPIIVVVGLLLFFMNQMQGGGSRVMNFGKAKAKLVTKETPKTTFGDVAGADEAIEELQEIKEFLENPAKFQAVGAKIPKGVLLYGPPGTGKTLLARAVAGEAGVPFYSISGSDFVEMFVGVGASRVRDLFEQAKTNAPAIIFIDEIDAVGRHRGAGLGGGHDEREQTLNQLLVEMDGFDVKGGVILIAATNRPDILDPALLRPGRFDRQIVVDRPDLEGRKGILAVHAKGKPLGPDVDLDVIARRTPGFTGADLANVINEAALLTARMDRHEIDGKTLEESIDRVMAGPERKSRVMSDREKKIIAYHEGGHALVAHALPNSDPVHKVTILPRGRALGYTMTLPTEDKFLTTRSEMVDQLAMLLGGRTAEELVFHEPTTGASNDIEKATQISRAMITEYGMSDRLGARKFGQNEGEVFLGRDMGHQRDYSEQIAAAIDDEVRGLIESAHDVAWEILVQYRDVLDDLVLKLMDKETLTKDEVLAVFAPIQRRPLQASYTGWGKRKPSDQPPVLTPRELALIGPADVRELTGDAGVSMTKASNGNGNGSASSNGSAGYGSTLGTSPAPASPPPPTPAGPAPTVEPPSSQPGS